MKQHLSIALLLLLLSVCSFAQAQIEVVHPEEDPVRLPSPSRPHREASVTAPDTLKLPFFEDFTDHDPKPVKKSVIDTVGGPVEITSYTPHGLANGDSILIYGVAEHSALNDTFWVNILSPYVFQLNSKTGNTLIPYNGIGVTITKLGWNRLPYKNRVDLLITASPDPKYWIQNGGTYINDRYAIEPPSYNVATFDGLNYLGSQYNGSNFNAQGLADNLTSVPIDLSTVGTPDSLYISFYWQCAGIGEEPETNDYLLLEFKDTADNWIEVWRMYGNSSVATTKHFTRANVAISDSAYIFNGFQFRFKNRGRLSGPFDVWNLDGIYLDSGRHWNDFIDDWAISRGQHTFLKNHSAMPYEHYFSDKTSQTCVTDSITIINTSGRKATYEVVVEMYDNTGGVNTYLADSPPIGLSVFSGPYREDADLALNYGPLVTTNAPRGINLYYYIKSQEDMYSPLFSCNNYYTTKTILWDYYAYDDGTPEYAIKTVAGGVNIGNQYTLSPTVSDVLTDVDICFTKNAGIDMEGRTVILTVWSNHNNKPSSVIGTQQSIAVHYPDPFYGFYRYHLNTPINIAAGDTFYVGYVQNFTDPLFIGYDASIDHSDKLFYQETGSWVKYSDDQFHIPGSMMIRPVFDNGEILTPVIDPTETSFNVVMYPNPADDLLYISGDADEVVITDLLGRTVLTYKNNQTGNLQHILNTASLADGIYLVKMTSSNGATKTEKLLVR